jgi:glutathione S-transferase
MSDYILYSREGSGSMVIEAALAMAGARCALKPVSKDDPAALAEVARLNPAAKIPVLILPGGRAVSETMAIILILDELHPEAGLLPRPGTADRPAALQWLAFLASSTYPAALRFFYPDRMTSDKSEAAVSAVNSAAGEALDEDMGKVLAELTHPFLFAAGPTIVDVYALMLADWHGTSLADPRMIRLKQALLAIPAVRTAWLSHDYAV